jgi:YhcH/YjgK/YiaL family protein
MIAANLSALDRYKPMGPNLAAAIAWIRKGGWDSLPEGKHEIVGSKVYALVSRYPSKQLSAARWETHREYIDIQLVVSGKEFVEVRDVQGMTSTEPYKPDIEFYALPEGRTAHEMLLEPGVALILYPEDAHRPGIAIGGVSEPIHKIVVKVAVDL